MSASVNLNLARRIDGWGGALISFVLFAWARWSPIYRGSKLRPMRATTPPEAEPLPRPRRILAIKFYGLGNITMLLPVLHALRHGCPGAEIDFLTLSENTELLARSGLTDRVLSVRTDSYRELLATLWGTFRALCDRNYDLVIDFEQFLKLSSILAFLTGAKHRFGFNTDGQHRGWLYTVRVVYTDSEHTSRIFMRLLRPLRIDTTPRPTSIATAEEDDRYVRELIESSIPGAGEHPLVVVHVASGMNFYRVPLKRWPIESFAQLSEGLCERYDATIVFTGKGDEERLLVREAREAMKRDAVDAVDRLSIAQLLALLKMADLVVCNDTSVMHLAAALRSPVVAFFGPTAPLQYGPVGEDNLIFYKNFYCSPCLTNYNLKVSYCWHPVCVRSISVDEVLEGIEKKFLGPEARRLRVGDPAEGAAR